MKSWGITCREDDYSSVSANGLVFLVKFAVIADAIAPNII
jgi:hypothetical protein